MRALEPLGVVLLLAVHAALCVDTLGRKSVTEDEVGHLPAEKPSRTGSSGFAAVTMASSTLRHQLPTARESPHG
jgi:hypothetical protein